MFPTFLSNSHLLTFDYLIYLHSMLHWLSVNKSSRTKLWKIITCDTVFSLRCQVTTFPISRQSQIIFSHTGRSSRKILRLLLRTCITLICLLTPVTCMMDSIGFPLAGDSEQRILFPRCLNTIQISP